MQVLIIFISGVACSLAMLIVQKDQRILPLIGALFSFSCITREFDIEKHDFPQLMILLGSGWGRKILVASLWLSVAQQPILAIDTESNSLFAYQEQVCLIQISTPQVDYLVDPLALTDLSPLSRIFADPNIEKVFHAAEYDLICLQRDFGFRFANLFDTMLAARILGRKEFGLGAILEAEFGVFLDKRHQRANWGQRPMPAHLVQYASQDSHYLIPLRDRLRAELVEKQLWYLALEDFNRLSQLNHALNNNGRGQYWRIAGAHVLTPQQAAVLQELCAYRDQMARTYNRPLFKVIGDQTLLVRKLGGATAVALGLFVLELSGYVADQPQSPTTLGTIRVLTAVVPGVFVALGAWVALGYPLTRARHDEILAELVRRRVPA